MSGILIFGAGQVAQVFESYLGMAKAFVVDDEYADVGGEYPLPVVGISVLRFDPERYRFVVGLSFKGLNTLRAKKYQTMLDAGYEPFTFVHYRAINAGNVGRGSFVMELNNIQHGVEIGENCVLWSGNHIGHHTKIGNHVWISSHAVISGSVEIGDRTFVGVNATIADGVKIGKDCIIGAAAVITADCPDGGVYPGPRSERSSIPATKMRGIWARPAYA